MRESIRTLTLDLCPYKVSITKTVVRIHDAVGSVLGKLRNEVDHTGDKTSIEHRLSWVPRLPKDGWASRDKRWFEVCVDNDDIVFTGEGGPVTFHQVVRWIEYNFDAINSIGWKVLKKRDE